MLTLISLKFKAVCYETHIAHVNMIQKPSRIVDTLCNENEKRSGFFFLMQYIY